MRLDKLLAHLNYGSRKEVKEYIRNGLVLVDGDVITDDDYKVDETKSEITFLGKKIEYKELLYFIMNKPKGYVSATIDKEPTVIDLIDGYQNRGLFPVGRLDKDTTGLLLITNDGLLAHEMLSPKKHVNKIYEMVFVGTFKEEYYQKFIDGIVLDDGYKCLSAKFELLSNNRGRITIKEGKYHQVKRMMLVLGLEVTELKRVSFGPLVLPNDLNEGSYRELTETELKLLKR